MVKHNKISRLSCLPINPSDTFFLWGPRKAGKTSLLKMTYQQAKYFDLLKTDLHLRLVTNPAHFRELVLALEEKFIIVDEIQKIPALLDEIHWLIENNDNIFGLCGSSARKVKNAQANLLGGRAIRYELYGFVYPELENAKIFSLIQIINRGTIPSHYLSENAVDLIEGYVIDYLKEEIAAEGLVRNLPEFSDFLRIVAISDTELVNYSNIASDCGVSSVTIKNYYQILIDTLLGSYLPAYTRRPKRRIIEANKFYFFDVGIVNFLAKRKDVLPGSELFGKAFENYIFHELYCYNKYKRKRCEIFYWKLTTGVEVDFIINDMEIAIECKSSRIINNKHLKSLRELHKDHPTLKKKIVISLETEARCTEDQIMIYPVEQFLALLWEDKIF